VQDWYVKPSPRLHLRRTPGEQESRLQRLVKGLSDDEILALLADPTEDFATLRRYNALLKAPAVFDTVKFELENGLLDKVVIYGYHKEALASAAPASAGRGSARRSSTATRRSASATR
jgi:hypothetical protein